MTNFDKIMECLKVAEKVAIFTHEKPDGDALGSAFAAKAILEALSKKAEVFLLSELPEKFSYLGTEYNLSQDVSDFDTALSVDCAALKRLGVLAESYIKIPTKLALDHHLSNTPFGDIFYSEHDCAANAELIYKMAYALIGSVPKEAMTGIYTGLSTDTGHFKYSNVTQKTMTIAAELVGMGLDHRKITSAIYDTVKLSKLKFTGAVAERIKFMSEGRISFLYCSDELMESYNICSEELDELPNMVLSIEGVMVGILLKDNDGSYKISLRGKDVCDLSKIAASFGGGGHANAAAFSVKGDKDKIIEELVKKIEAVL